MKILYLSCHGVLEYDEIRLFNELGHEVVSTGAYRIPNNPHEHSRPSIPNAYYDEKLTGLASVNGLYAELNQGIIDWADIIIVTQHKWLTKNWDKMRDKIVIYRTIGQTAPWDEESLQKYHQEGLKLVRYSSSEERIPNYAGQDAQIRFYKDPEEWGEWNGNIPQVIMVGQSMIKRAAFMKFDVFTEATKDFKRKIYGPDMTEAGELWGGFLSYDGLRETLRDNRIAFQTCTHPAPYTLTFIEAFITGIPMVSIGRGLAGYDWLEAPDLIENGINGFVSDNIKELRQDISLLLNDYDLAKNISKEGRKKAIELFGKDTIKNQWKDFLGSLEK
jgi:glycosyltransferase involved in cell wall biosynthesis